VTNNKIEFLPVVLNHLWDSEPVIRSRYGMLTGGALLRALIDLQEALKEIGELKLQIEGMEESMMLLEEAYADLQMIHHESGSARLLGLKVIPELLE
jgi:hypothetical protein